MSGPLERKAVLPPAVMAALTGIVVAGYKAVVSFGWFHPTAAQTGTLAGLGTALLIAVGAAVGYLAPHTPRPDLTGTGPNARFVLDQPAATVNTARPSAELSQQAAQMPAPVPLGSVQTTPPPAPTVFRT